MAIIFICYKQFDKMWLAEFLWISPDTLRTLSHIVTLGSFLLPAVEDQIKVFQLAAQGPAPGEGWQGWCLQFTSAARKAMPSNWNSGKQLVFFTNLTCDSWLITANAAITAKRSPTALLPNQIWIKSQHCLSSKGVRSAQQISCK